MIQPKKSTDMKINLEKLKEYEQKYRRSSNVVCLKTLETMVDIVLSNVEGGPQTPPFTYNFTVALQTLESMGIVQESDKKPEPQHLNS